MAKSSSGRLVLDGVLGGALATVSAMALIVFAGPIVVLDRDVSETVGWAILIVLAAGLPAFLVSCAVLVGLLVVSHVTRLPQLLVLVGGAALAPFVILMAVQYASLEHIGNAMRSDDPNQRLAIIALAASGAFGGLLTWMRQKSRRKVTPANSPTIPKA